jgi:hypothetical protein
VHELFTHLGQTIEPVGSSRQQGNLLKWHTVRNEFIDGVRDEEIGKLDPVPQVLPDLTLRRASNVNEITADFYVRAIDNGDLRTSFADERDEARHLRIIDEDDIGTSCSKWATFGEPITLSVVLDPLGELLLLSKSQTKGRVGDTLEDV